LFRAIHSQFNHSFPQFEHIGEDKFTG